MRAPMARRWDLIVGAIWLCSVSVVERDPAGAPGRSVSCYSGSLRSAMQKRASNSLLVPGCRPSVVPFFSSFLGVSQQAGRRRPGMVPS